MGTTHPRMNSLDIALHNACGVNDHFEEIMQEAGGDLELATFLAWGHNSTMIEKGTTRVFVGKELISRIIKRNPSKFSAEQVLVDWAMALGLDPDQVIGDWELKGMEGATRNKVRTFDFGFLQERLGLSEQRHKQITDDVV